MVIGTWTGAVEILTEVVSAPITFRDMSNSILEDLNVPLPITQVFGFIILFGLYILIVFAIISAFSPGGGKL